MINHTTGGSASAATCCVEHNGLAVSNVGPRRESRANRLGYMVRIGSDKQTNKRLMNVTGCYWLLLLQGEQPAFSKTLEWLNVKLRENDMEPVEHQ